MTSISDHAHASLRSSPHPALRLSELLDLVRSRAGTAVTVPVLRANLERHPDRFRIIEAWEGRWERPGKPKGRRDARTGDVDARLGPDADAWVVAVGGPDGAPDPIGPALRLRESVRWVALELDGRSSLDVSRWYAIAMAERETRSVIARRAA